MSTHKANGYRQFSHKKHRAKLHVQLKGFSNSLREDRKPQKLVCEANPYKVTLKHIRANTRLAARSNVPMGEESDRMSRRCREIIENYESYALRKKYTGEKAYSIGEYIRQYARKEAKLTVATRNEVLAWYTAHGHERIARMRKMHAIVGSINRPILRTE